jgi:ribonuclease HIII
MTEPSTKPFVAQIDIALGAKMRLDLVEKGFIMTTPPYTVWSAKKPGVTCTLYTSGKLVVQGKEKAALLEFYLEPEILGTFTHSYPTLQLDDSARIGMDESGKGDFYGPLCVAGVYASGQQVNDLFALGVCDSKKLSDPVVNKMAPQIEKLCPHFALVITPQRYNELYRGFGNLNHLLAWGHATVIEHLVAATGCHNVILDQFAYPHVMDNALRRKNVQVALTQRPRAEEDVVVAAASVVARYRFLKGLAELSQHYGITLPKGAASIVITTGRQFVRQHGPEALPSVAKMHFKTVDAIIP